MKSIFNILSLAVVFSTCYAQLPMVNLPTIPAPTMSVYISPTGNDANPGTKVSPMKTFRAAMLKIPFGTANINGGNYYGEVVCLAGDYYPSPQTRFHQYLEDWRKKVPNTWVYRNVSIRGEGVVNIHGNLMDNQLVYLYGRGISVKNINLLDNKHTGLYIDGSLIKHNSDVVVDNVLVDNIDFFGLYIKGYDRVLIQNCEVKNTCAANKNSALCQWASGVEPMHCTHVTIKNSKVHHNWGEGINPAQSRYVKIIDNAVYDNYSVNIYAHAISYAIISNNLIYSSDSTYWNTCYGSGKVSDGISIANETTGDLPNTTCGSNKGSYIVTDDYNYPNIPKTVSYFKTNQIYVFNNVLLNTSINIWDALTSFGIYSYINNIFIDNNTLIGTGGASNLGKSPLSLNLNLNFVYFNNIKIRNNIISYDPNNVNNIPMIAAAPNGVCNTLNFLSKIYLSKNMWIAKPNISGLNVSNDIQRSILPHQSSASDFSNLNPSINSAMAYTAASQSYITEDYYHNPRNYTSTNVGAIAMPLASQRVKSETNAVNKTQNKFNVYPNPNNGNFTINIPTNGTINIYDIQGAMIYTSNVYEGINEINIDAIAAKGMFTIIYLDGINVESVKMIRQ